MPSAPRDDPSSSKTRAKRPTSGMYVPLTSNGAGLEGICRGAVGAIPNTIRGRPRSIPEHITCPVTVEVADEWPLGGTPGEVTRLEPKGSTGRRLESVGQPQIVRRL